MEAALSAFLKYAEMGGYVMPPLILATMALWFGLGFRFSVLRKGRGYEPRQAVAAVVDGRLVRPKSAVERAAILGVQQKDETTFNLRARLDETFSYVEQDLSKYKTLTSVIVAVAPLLGLLGTVSGMIETFASLGDMTLYSQSGGHRGRDFQGAADDAVRPYGGHPRSDPGGHLGSPAAGARKPDRRDQKHPHRG